MKPNPNDIAELLPEGYCMQAWPKVRENGERHFTIRMYTAPPDTIGRSYAERSLPLAIYEGLPDEERWQWEEDNVLALVRQLQHR